MDYVNVYYSHCCGLCRVNHLFIRCDFNGNSSSYSFGFDVKLNSIDFF